MFFNVFLKISALINLCALAAVAVAGAASAADFTISGSFAYGYQSAKTSQNAAPYVWLNNDGSFTVGKSTDIPAGTDGVEFLELIEGDDNAVAAQNKDKGFGVDTAAITITATEDLGNGLKLASSMSLGGITRGDAAVGEDFSMTLSGGFGKVMMGQVEIGSGIRGLAQAGAPVNNMEGEVLGAASKGTDIVKYTAPTMSGFTPSVSLTEDKGLAIGLGSGSKKTSAVTAGVDYAVGALKAKFDVTDYNSTAPAKKVDDRYRVAFQYDLGIAKIGAGVEAQDIVGGGTNEYVMYGVSLPVSSAVTLGAVWTSQDSSAKTGDKVGYSVGAEYVFTKRTSLTANYAKWDAAEGGTTKDTKTTVLLNHSF